MRTKVITVKTRTGKRRKQRVAVLASGRYKFIKNRGGARMARKRRRRAGKSSGKTLGGMGGYIGPVAYGYFRQNLSDAIKNTGIAAKLPATNFTDEAVMLGSIILLRKFGVGKSGILSSVMKAGKSIELARIGSTLQSQGLGLGTSKSNGNGSGLFDGGGF